MGQRSPDSILEYIMLSVGRGIEKVCSGPLSEALVKGHAWKSSLVGYGSDQGLWFLQLARLSLEAQALFTSRLGGFSWTCRVLIDQGLILDFPTVLSIREGVIQSMYFSI